MLEQLLQRRETLREKLFSGPGHDRIVELRKAIVSGKHAGADVSKLEKEREGLVAERAEQLAVVDEAVHAERAKLRGEKNDSLRSSLRTLDDEQLEKRRHSLTEQSKKIALELEACASELGARSRRKRLADQLELMSDADRKLFLKMLSESEATSKPAAG